MPADPDPSPRAEDISEERPLRTAWGGVQSSGKSASRRQACSRVWCSDNDCHKTRARIDSDGYVDVQDT